MGQRLSQLNSPVVKVGIAAGFVGVLISMLGRGLNPGRVLADPLPVVLSVAQITRGLLYWNWQGVLVHVLFYLFLPVLSVAGIYFWHNEKLDFIVQAFDAGRLTAVINVVVVALQQIDAFTVAVYYLFGGFLMVWISGISAKWLAKKIENRDRE